MANTNTTEKLVYDYSKLLGKIIEKFRSQQRFAPALGLSERSLSLKLNNMIDFKQNEISKCCTLLGIEQAEIHEYFFTLKV